MKINKRLLPIKAHYFFFMAAMGPILPQITVFGKQLGISSSVMGCITGILPILFLFAKPAFGFVADYFLKYRKSIFVGLIIVTCISFSLLYFLPKPLQDDVNEDVYDFLSTSNNIRTCNSSITSSEMQCLSNNENSCIWNCTDIEVEKSNISLILYRNNEDLQACYIKETHIPYCSKNVSCICNCECDPSVKINYNCLSPATFWKFVIFISIGAIGFNVGNCVSDAICFDMLGENGEMQYGQQRMWGTIGFGISALASGFLVNYMSEGEIKNYTPMFIVILVMAFFDLLSCKNLKLPKLQSSKNIFKDVKDLFHHIHIVIFLIFATLIGIIDGFIAFFLFWYLEDLAAATGNMSNIKLLEGLTVAAETLVGEVIFFLISGKLLQKLGYGHAFTLCFLFYGLRLALVSLINSPWYILLIELFMQGPTYAMSYTTIVAYTSAISPPGTSATMQGIAAGMDDGFGYAIGSFVGGLLYEKLGGKITWRIFSGLGFICGLIHFILYITILHKSIPKIEVQEKEVVYKSPNEAIEVTDNVS